MTGEFEPNSSPDIGIPGSQDESRMVDELNDRYLTFFRDLSDNPDLELGEHETVEIREILDLALNNLPDTIRLLIHEGYGLDGEAPNEDMDQEDQIRILNTIVGLRKPEMLGRTIEVFNSGE